METMKIMKSLFPFPEGHLAYSSSLTSSHSSTLVFLLFSIVLSVMSSDGSPRSNRSSPGKANFSPVGASPSLQKSAQERPSPHRAMIWLPHVPHHPPSPRKHRPHPNTDRQIRNPNPNCHDAQMRRPQLNRASDHALTPQTGVAASATQAGIDENFEPAETHAEDHSDGYFRF